MAILNLTTDYTDNTDRISLFYLCYLCNRWLNLYFLCHAVRGIVRPLPVGTALPFGAATVFWLARTLPTRASTWSMVSRSTRADCCIAKRSFGVSGNSICWRTPPQPTTVGTDKHTSRMPYRPGCKLLTGSTRRLSRASDSTTSRIDNPTAKPEPPLSLISCAPAVFVSSNTSRCTAGVKVGHCSSGRPATVALDQIGTMLSPCSPRIIACTCDAGTCRLLAR